MSTKPPKKKESKLLEEDKNFFIQFLFGIQKELTFQARNFFIFLDRSSGNSAEQTDEAAHEANNSF